MDTRILTTFPTPGHPSPRITSNLRNFPVRHPPGTRPTAATRLNRWFCCKCADKGYKDPIGMVNHSDSASPTEPCWRPPCNHTKCPNCLASPTHNVHDAIRTFGGLHTSPTFIDPIFWECSCGEWAKNPFGEAHSTMGITLCASQTCDFRYRNPLRPESIVMNAYGQRLGTADQTVAVLNGPWYWQRRGLGDGANAILDAFRRQQHRRDLPSLAGSANGGQRMLPPMITASSLTVTWVENQPAPRYPYRPPPPSSNSDGADDAEGLKVAYKMAYLAGIPSEQSVGLGEGEGAVIVDLTGESFDAGKGVLSSSARSHLNFTDASLGRFAGSVGVADHVQIQMQMRMQSQTSREVLPRWM